jgi:flagellar basal-body rod protein FlgG
MMLQAIIQLATQNSGMHMQVMEKVSKNVANYATNGYKSERFDLYLNQEGTLKGVTRVDTTAGAPLITRNEFDIAIESPNQYFQVVQPDGTVAYTRDGRFKLGKDGYLITQQGDLLSPGFKIPTGYGRVLIYPDGRVMTQPKKEGPKTLVGTLNLAQFTNAEELESIGGNKLIPTAGSGDPQLATQIKLAQGKVETANVDLFEQVEATMRLNAGVLSNLRMVKFADELFRQAVNLRQ